MSFFAQRWGVSRGLSDNLPSKNPTPDEPKTPDMTAIEAAKDFYDQTGLSDKNFSADDRAKANELNKKFDEFKIPRYAICSPRGGISYRAIGESCNDKENIRYTSEKVLSRYLDNNYGVGIDTFKSNTITELRGKIKPKEKKDKPEPKAKSEPKPKSEPKAKKEDKPEPKAKFSTGDFVWHTSDKKILGEEYKVVSSSFDKNRKEFAYVLRPNRGVKKQTFLHYESYLEKTDGKEILHNDKSDDWLDIKKSKSKQDCPPVPPPRAATPVVAKPKPESKPESGDGKKEELNKKIDNLTELLNRAVKKPAA